LRFADFGKQLALRHYASFLGAAAVPSRLILALSPHAALRAAHHARRKVPAYRDLLARSNWQDHPRWSPLERLQSLPVTDKETYIKVFSTEARCVGGQIPLMGTRIDESSGSSGTPYNWVRSAAELREVHRELAQFIRYACGTQVITINGFTM